MKKTLFILTPILGLLSTGLSYFYEKIPGDVILHGFPLHFYTIDTINLDPVTRVKFYTHLFGIDFAIWCLIWAVLFLIIFGIKKITSTKRRI